MIQLDEDTSAAQATGGRILVVDDVEDNRIILARNLTRAGYDTEMVETGVAALAMVSTEPPDLILLDWMMPGLSGIEVLSAIREHYDANQLPIIMCTARDETTSMVAALNAGANDYIQKPVNIPIAIARINAQLQRKQALIALADINRSLEEELAQRTRALMSRQNEWSAGDAAQATAALNDILRLTSWLRNNDAAQDPNLRDVCLDSIVSSARRLAAR